MVGEFPTHQRQNFPKPLLYYQTDTVLDWVFGLSLSYDIVEGTWRELKWNSVEVRGPEFMILLPLLIFSVWRYSIDISALSKD